MKIFWNVLGLLFGIGIIVLLASQVHFSPWIDIAVRFGVIVLLLAGTALFNTWKSKRDS